MFKLAQKGQSLPIVLGVAALIMANTYYFLSVDKVSTSRTKLAEAEVSEQTEATRVASFLADYNICANQSKATGNFYNKDISTLTSTSGISFSLVKAHITSPPQPFLTNNGIYANNGYRVKKYYFDIDKSISDAELKYFLKIEYELIDKNNNLKGSIIMPKKTAIVKVPLFVEVSAGKVINCYARPAEDNTLAKNSLSAAATAACTLPPLPEVDSTYTSFLDTSSNVTKCQHTLTPIICPAGQALVETKSNPGSATNTQQFSCLGFLSTCGTSPVQQVGSSVTNSAINCVTPNNQGCGAGSVMIKNGTSISCSTNCPTTQLFNRINSSGTPTCYERTEPCPISGQYAKTINADGTPSCSYITYRNVNCGDLNYATDVDPGTASAPAANPLKCSSYSRYKDCAGSFNFVSSFASPSVACRNLNY